MKKAIALFSLAAIIAYVSLYVLNNDKKNEQIADFDAGEEQVEGVEVIVVASEDDEETEQVETTAAVHEVISQAHETLNNITGWDNHNKYKDSTSDEWKGITQSLHSHADRIEAASDLIEGDLKEDLEDFVMITRYAADSHDHSALLYSHRIIHDVDTVYNDKEKSTFNASRLSNWGGSAKRTIERLLGETGSDE
ncbi:hypothetical protein ACFFHM_15585 [Halalkalibacter kiskunsagensis]|uniref:Uncharacterized protein n=1 Tax=Halalkalibacter kiskunsagensis TaxID=1548599 RepID=A0ABV6KEY5_9BACI